MNEKQQTAVQWLMERIRERQALAEPGSKPSFKPLFDKALEMEREQMIQFADNYTHYFNFGGEKQPDGSIHVLNSGDYFNETYQTEQ